MSNDEAEGFRGVGASGWHVDGTSYEHPFQLSSHLCLPTAVRVTYLTSRHGTPHDGMAKALLYSIAYRTKRCMVEVS